MKQVESCFNLFLDHETGSVGTSLYCLDNCMVFHVARFVKYCQQLLLRHNSVSTDLDRAVSYYNRF